MAISKTKNYLVLNYGHSPVCISTKYENYLIPGAEGDMPASLPLTIDEIQVVNSSSPVFRVGMLRFEPDVQKDIYEELRIQDWKDILTDAQIEGILLHPTAETLQRLISIESEPYYERIRGIYMGLKNSGADISMKVATAIEARREEFINRKNKTDIKVTPIEQDAKAVSSKEVDDLKRQLAEMQHMMAKMMAGKADDKEPAKKGVTTKK